MSTYTKILKSKFVFRSLYTLLVQGGIKKYCAMIKSIIMYIYLCYTYNDFFLFLFQMKPREAYFLATAVLFIGFTIAQDQLFECPRGKFWIFPPFIIGILVTTTSSTYFCYHLNWLFMEYSYDEISKICFTVYIHDYCKWQLLNSNLLALFSENYRLLSLRDLSNLSNFFYLSNFWAGKFFFSLLHIYMYITLQK